MQGPATGFYGPQLQVPWVVQVPVNRSRYGNYEDGDDDDDDDDDEIDELKEMLGMAKNIKRNNTSAAVIDSDTASAYLRSSYSGVMKTKTVLMAKSPDRSDYSRKSEQDASTAAASSSFFGPQLGPVDWVGELNSREKSFKNRLV